MNDALPPNVHPFPGAEPLPRPPGTRVLAGLIIVMRGLVQIARLAMICGLFLLAAVGALTLLGR
jgi:hypothetical protein